MIECLFRKKQEINILKKISAILICFEFWIVFLNYLILKQVTTEQIFFNFKKIYDLVRKSLNRSGVLPDSFPKPWVRVPSPPQFFSSLPVTPQSTTPLHTLSMGMHWKLVKITMLAFYFSISTPQATFFSCQLFFCVTKQVLAGGKIRTLTSSSSPLNSDHPY